MTIVVHTVTNLIREHPLRHGAALWRGGIYKTSQKVVNLEECVYNGFRLEGADGKYLFDSVVYSARDDC